MTSTDCTADIADHRHTHDFRGPADAASARRIWIVIVLTAVTMVAEIAAGSIFGSMALLADGWHMGTHLAALSIAALGYWVAQRLADDPRFAFGTGKVGDLAAFASAIGLGFSAVFIAWEAFERLVSPVAIRFEEAMLVAAIGLVVNLASAWILGGEHHHPAHGEHGHAHQDSHGDHDHGPGGHRDHNLKAAYMHVLADALTSILAIAALLAGLFAGWVWMDAAVALLGAGVIAWWSWGLLRRTSLSLLGADTPDGLEDAVRKELLATGREVADLHLWSVGPGHFAVSACVVSHEPADPVSINERIRAVPGVSHATIEVRRCCVDDGRAPEPV